MAILDSELISGIQIVGFPIFAFVLVWKFVVGELKDLKVAVRENTTQTAELKNAIQSLRETLKLLKNKK